MTRNEHVFLHIDRDEANFHLDARPGYTARSVSAGLDAARQRGLEPLPPEECEVDLLVDGTVRIWLVPIEETTRPAASAPQMTE